jgi:hypothetical protein
MPTVSQPLSSSCCNGENRVLVLWSLFVRHTEAPGKFLLYLADPRVLLSTTSAEIFPNRGIRECMNSGRAAGGLLLDFRVSRMSPMYRKLMIITFCWAESAFVIMRSTDG